MLISKSNRRGATADHVYDLFFRDGMISKSEMRSYFLRAKYHDLKGEFKHDFHETTYFKPTFCVHCTGLLWGLIKQGWKCKGKVIHHCLSHPSFFSFCLPLDCGINAHRHCKDQVVMECRQKRPNPVNKQGSVSDSRPSRSSFRIRKTRKQKATQTEDINFSSSTSSSATSESCTNSSDDEQQQQQQQQPPTPASAMHDKSSQQQQPPHSWHLRKPSSHKHRKAILSDSNDDYYYTHPPSPQQQQLIAASNPPAQQLIPRGPLICSDSFEKWSDRGFTWNRPLPPPTLLSSAPSNSTATSDSTTSITTTTKTEISEDGKNDQHLLACGQAVFFEGDVTDDDEPRPFTELTTSSRLPGLFNHKQRAVKTDRKDVALITSPTADSSHDDYEDDACFTTEATYPTCKSPTNFGSSQNLYPRKLSLSESLHSLPNKSDLIQNEIFERLRQAEEVRKECSPRGGRLLRRRRLARNVEKEYREEETWRVWLAGKCSKLKNLIFLV